MFLLLIPLALILSALVALSYSKDVFADCWRQCVLLSALACGLILYAGTETLSLYKLVSPGYSAGFWGLVCIALAVLLWSRPENLAAKLRRSDSPPLESTEKLMLAAICFIAAVTFILAVAVPPNNWDSMTYHLPRVMHWQQNMSVEFYPTHITRQLHRAPFAEYAILHLQLLWGGDRFFNLVQWGAMVGSLIAVSLLASVFGASRKIQFASALVAATLPMGIMQASTTQNDYLCAFFVLCFVWLLHTLDEKSSLPYYLATGSALGLAIATKTTTLVFAAPFGLWFAITRLRDRNLILKTCAGLVLAAAINLPHIYRNMAIYGAPLAPPAGLEDFYVLSNDSRSVKNFASTAMRVIGLELNTPSKQERTALEAAIRGLHRLIHSDPDAPAATFPASPVFALPEKITFEDTAPNPLHFLLLAAALFWPGFWRSRQITAHTLLTLCGAAALCFFLKWTPWHTRYHIIPFTLLAPAICTRLAGTRTLRFILPMLTLASSYWLFFNIRKPIFERQNIFNMTRQELYLMGRPGNTQKYLSTAGIAKQLGCDNVGLVMGPDSWEYPLWILLNQDKKRTIQHINVSNPSGKIPQNAGNPCLVVDIQPEAW